MEAGDSSPQGPADTSPASHADNAARYLSRARKAYNSTKWEPNPEAEFMLESAKVEALLDVAEALRDGKP